MSGTEHDEYLWNRGEPIDLEIAKLERELDSLRWRPRSLALPLAIVAHEKVPTMPMHRSPDHSRSRGWPALIAGLAMAATVLGAVYLARPTNEVFPANEPTPGVESIDPAGQPQGSPDLRDPFSSAGDPPAPKAGELQDPFDRSPREQTRTPQPHWDLKDPFSKSPGRPSDEPAPEPEDRSSDLKDPFGRSSEGQSPQSDADGILDPFSKPTPMPSEQSKHSGSDLADPFTNQH